jgi:hypothetical protein
MLAHAQLHVGSLQLKHNSCACPDLLPFCHVQNEQIDYRAQIRPDAETTNQTLRMFGTYEGDYAAARQAGVFIPQASPRVGGHAEVLGALRRSKVIGARQAKGSCFGVGWVWHGRGSHPSVDHQQQSTPADDHQHS